MVATLVSVRSSADVLAHEAAARSGQAQILDRQGDPNQDSLMAWHKSSRHERGYGADWDRLRQLILQRDCGICQPCKRKGVIHTGTEVDHIISKAKAKRMRWTDAQINAESNLQVINSECHKAKTADESGYALKPKVRIGLDGFPVECTEMGRG
jgi:5-methylcytosine-specific restriction protein A